MKENKTSRLTPQGRAYSKRFSLGGTKNSIGRVSKPKNFFWVGVWLEVENFFACFDVDTFSGKRGI